MYLTYRPFFASYTSVKLTFKKKMTSALDWMPFIFRKEELRINADAVMFVVPNDRGHKVIGVKCSSLSQKAWWRSGGKLEIIIFITFF